MRDQTRSGQLVDHFFRHEYARLVATLTRRFGMRHWELVEDVVQSALQRALSKWPASGIPENPSAWLHRVASNLAIDALRRDRRRSDIEGTETPAPTDIDQHDEDGVQDDLLRMIFVCCDPAVPPESQIALALKTLCGFSNGEVARALLTTEASIAKRVTRAKHRLRDMQIEPAQFDNTSMRSRLADVQSVVYLLFNEGYSSSLADKLIREELCEEAVRLALLLAEHPLTEGRNSAALLAVLLFHAARLEARMDEGGAMLLLREQDRSKWDAQLIREGYRWLQFATRDKEVCRYHAEAWIAAEHCRASSIEDTNWRHIASAYDVLCAIHDSPVHRLNRAIAIGYRDGPKAGLEEFSRIPAEEMAENYYLWHATRAELARQIDDIATARESLQKAWHLAPTNAEKELICRKLDAL